MNSIIEVRDVSKAYQIGQFSTGTVTNDLQRWWLKLRGKEDPFLKIGEANDRTTIGKSNIVWSLKDINFDIKAGDTVGILGRNGAGKSTLLKLLSRVTSPTTGTIGIKGRVSSLLEVGTGFHPELTGRENVYLNGAILGMRKHEITQRFDEIVAFSGVERYIDTPVKRYSSGMYVRLAFAVAAHLQSEVLIVDEVLAVGDAEFQKKCLGKMDDISKGQGRTILFVSHNLPMIASLCRKGIILKNGALTYEGNASTAIHYYQNGEQSSSRLDYSHADTKPGNEFAELLEAHLEDQHGEITSELNISQGFKVTMRYTILKDVPLAPLPNFHFYDQFGQHAFVASPGSQNPTGYCKKGDYSATCLIPANFFNTGNFTIGVALTFIHDGIEVSFFEQSALNFTTIEDLNNSPTRVAQFGGPIPGVFRPKFEWVIK